MPPPKKAITLPAKTSPRRERVQASQRVRNPIRMDNRRKRVFMV